MDYPKKKNLKHVNRLKYFDQNLAEAIKNKTVRNEEIKRAIKMLQVEISEKEDE